MGDDLKIKAKYNNEIYLVKCWRSTTVKQIIEKIGGVNAKTSEGKDVNIDGTVDK